jgi:transcriptional regulator with XRE-family HTH domain
MISKGPSLAGILGPEAMQTSATVCVVDDLAPRVEPSPGVSRALRMGKPCPRRVLDLTETRIMTGLVPSRVCVVRSGVSVSDEYHGPAVIRRRLGARLKEVRGEKGFRLDEVAKRLNFSAAKLSRIETGKTAPKRRDLTSLLNIYEVSGGLHDELMQLAQYAIGQGWWQPLPGSARIPGDLNQYLSLEAEAAAIRQFSASAIPGLLQIEAYARDIIRSTLPQESDYTVDELVSIRLGRQDVLRRTVSGFGPLTLHAILDEAALHRGKPDVLKQQLRSLLMQTAHPNITIQVFPFTSGFDEAHSAFTIFDLREEGDSPVINVESTGYDNFYDRATSVALFNDIWQDLTDRSLTSGETCEYISALL